MLHKIPSRKLIALLTGVIEKCLHRVQVIWGKKEHAICRAGSIAYFLCKEELLSPEDLRRIHSRHSITKDSYNFVKVTICDKLESSEISSLGLTMERVRAAFDKYLPVIAS